MKNKIKNIDVTILPIQRENKTYVRKNLRFCIHGTLIYSFKEKT